MFMDLWQDLAFIDKRCELINLTCIAASTRKLNSVNEFYIIHEQTFFFKFVKRLINLLFIIWREARPRVYNAPGLVKRSNCCNRFYFKYDLVTLKLCKNLIVNSLIACTGFHRQTWNSIRGIFIVLDAHHCVESKCSFKQLWRILMNLIRLGRNSN